MPIHIWPTLPLQSSSIEKASLSVQVLHHILRQLIIKLIGGSGVRVNQFVVPIKQVLQAGTKDEFGVELLLKSAVGLIRDGRHFLYRQWRLCYGGGQVHDGRNGASVALRD